MGEKGVGEEVLLLVGGGVRLDAGFNQGQRHAAVQHGVAVFAVVQQAHAVVAFAQVHPLLAAAFETGHVPAGVLGDLALEVAELDVEGGLVGVNVHGKVNLEQVLMLVPVHPGFEVDAAAVRIEADGLPD